MGHVARMPDVRPVKALLYGVLEEGSRRVGRPFLRYKDTLKDILKRGAALGTWREVVTDQLAWRRLTSDICDKIENERRNRNIERRARRSLRKAGQSLNFKTNRIRTSHFRDFFFNRTVFLMALS